MSYIDTTPSGISRTFLVTTSVKKGNIIDEPTDPVDPVDPTDPVDPVDPVDPTDPVDPVDPNIPNDPSVKYPELDATSATSYMRFNVRPTVDNVSLQHYAVEVDGVVYNEDHSLNLVGSSFTIGDRSFFVPGGSSSSIVIYADDNEDTTPIMVRLIPSPDSSKNNIEGVDNYTGEGYHQYTGIDDDIFFLLIPNKGPNSIKATEEIVLQLHGGSVNDLGDYVMSPDLELSFDFNKLSYQKTISAENYQQLFSALSPMVCLHSTIDANGLAIFKVLTKDNDVATPVSIEASLGAEHNVEVDANRTPSVYYDEAQGGWTASIKPIKLTIDSPYVPLLATDHIEIYIPNYWMHGMPTCDVVLNGVTYNDIVFELSGTITLGDYTVSTSLSSGGSGYMFFETTSSEDTLSFKIIPKGVTIENGNSIVPTRTWSAFYDSTTMITECIVKLNSDS